MSTSSFGNRENLASGGQAQQKKALENVTKQPLGKSGKKMSSTGSGRKTLQTLQPSGKNQALLVGADGLLRMSGSKKKGSGPCEIYEDPPTLTSTPERQSSTKAVQAVQEAKEAGTQIEEADTAQVRAELFMYGEEFPPDYWKELAEKRREALDTSLAENEELHTSLSQLEEEKESLRKERDSLREMAQQAEQLAKIVKTLVDDGDEAAGTEEVLEEDDESEESSAENEEEEERKESEEEK